MSDIPSGVATQSAQNMKTGNFGDGSSSPSGAGAQPPAGSSLSVPLPVARPHSADGTRKRGWWERNLKMLKTMAVWASFFAVLYFFRSFLTLIFITFIMAYTMNSLITYLGQRWDKPRGRVVLVVYGMLCLVVTGMGMIVIPKVYQEGKLLSSELPLAKEKALASVRAFTQDPDYSKFIEGIGLEETIRERFGELVQSFSLFLQALFRTSFHFLLSIIFSFLILWDFERLEREVKGLETTRLSYVYRVLSPSFQQFGSILGRAFEAQIIIACVNTFLTLIGLTFLGIPSKLFLSVFVFICSFIPVLGVFISSAPICLLAYKAEGIFLVIYGAILIMVIHFIEAYILNPRIVGAHLSLHPFIAVTILVIGEYLFGIWGLLLGVPVSVFLYNMLVVLPAVANRPKGRGEEPKNLPVTA